MSGEGRFSESDLAPSADERRAERRALVERIGAALASVAAGISAGGLLALGVCAAPFVFRLTPAPFSGDAMGSAFARFDSIAIGCAVVVLGGEVARTWAAGRRGRTTAARVRRIFGILLAMSASYIGLALTPPINEMHRAGVRRGHGAEGAVLETIHARAELVGKAEVFFGLSLVALHVFTLGARRPDDDDEDALAPLPPGPFGAPSSADDA